MNFKHYKTRKEDLQLFSIQSLDSRSDNERLNRGNGDAVECKWVNKGLKGYRLKANLTLYM